MSSFSPSTVPFITLSPPTPPTPEWCCRCGQKSKSVCTCKKGWCEGCLQVEIDEWITLHEPKRSFNPLQPTVLLSERERTTLSRLERNVLRFHRLGTRARVCSYCKSELKCPQCSIFAYYQKCDKCPYDYSIPDNLPQYTSVCPRCVFHGALIPWPGIPSFHRFNHFLDWEVVCNYRPVVFFELKEVDSGEGWSDSGELESEDEKSGEHCGEESRDSRDDGDEERPKLRWRCHFHTPQEQALTKIYRELENKDR